MSPETPITAKQRIGRILYFFPVQLVLLQLKRNYLLLSFWLLLFAFVLDGIGGKYGISHLFLFPEYQGVNGVFAFGITGFSIGGFIVSYNLYTYIIHGHRFPFIATLEKPLFKFSLNNFLIPFSFIAVYYLNSYHFQVESELIEPVKAVLNLAGFTLGVLLMVTFSFAYFTFTNKNVRYYSVKKQKENAEDEKEETFASSALQKSRSWEDLEKRTDDWRVDTYMNSLWKVMLARSSKHYPREVLEKVFSQHHINASLFEMLIIISFIVIGLFREHSVFEIPAAASAVLYFTVLIMLFSALYSWIKGWTFPIILALLLSINYISGFTTWFNLNTEVYGLDYTVEKPHYSNEDIRNSITPESILRSNEEQKEALNNWKLRVGQKNGELPKLVVFSVSGGGLRSALWTMKSVLHADSVLDGELLEQVHLITGSSGGMVGASYLRELFLENNRSIPQEFQSMYLDNISKDILNPIILSMATHDIALRYRKVDIDGKPLLMDRAYAFERRLNQNTNGVLDRRLRDYTPLELTASIPTMIFSPTVNHDGRRLLISALGISNLCIEKSGELEENISYSDFFATQNPGNTRFTSILRMNATFPYVLPATTLPTQELIKVADAGLRDNFGMRITLSYLKAMEEWIAENTSGVVILEVRDTKKYTDREAGNRKLLSELSSPLGGVYSNMIRTQDYNNDLQFELTQKSYSVPIDRIPFELVADKDKPVTLSWHLTGLEKQTVLNGIHHPSYKESLSNLKALISDE